MLEEDRVKPNTFIFTNLLTALGRVGYTKKAFQLYNKVRNLTHILYTALIWNDKTLLYSPACPTSNCAFKHSNRADTKQDNYR